jgi:hypothetical protein
LSLPVALPLLLASLLRVPLLADCCVHPPLLPPPATISKKTFDTNINVSVSRQLASGHQSNKSNGNAVMLTSGWCDKSVQQELE